MFKKLPYIKNVILLGVGLIVMNFVYEKFFLDNDILKYSFGDKSRIINENDTSTILYVGESSGYNTHPYDKDKRRISSYINDYYPQEKVFDLSSSALHAGIFKILLPNIPEESNIKTVIVTLNLRSFNAGWLYSNLESPLLRQILLFQSDYPPLLRRFLLSFKGYEKKTDEEREQQVQEAWKNDYLKFTFDFPYHNVTAWDSAIAYQGLKDEKGVFVLEKTDLACQFIKSYAFQIDTLKNPRIKDFDDIVKYAKKRGWNIVFNLMAENVEKAQELVGKELIYLMNQNKELLIKRYKKQGVTVVDNFSLVSGDDFTDNNWTTEHYSERGRRIIARNVAHAIQKFVPSKMKEVNLDTSDWKTRYFDFDFEESGSLGQMKTVTTEKAHSGKKSSKISKESPYSITFERMVNALPYKYLDSALISFYIYKTTEIENAQLILTFEGGKVKYVGLTKNLAEINIPNSTWTRVTQKFKLPSNAPYAEITKVFVYNPDAASIFVDDLSITLY